MAAAGVIRPRDAEELGIVRDTPVNPVLVLEVGIDGGGSALFIFVDRRSHGNESRKNATDDTAFHLWLVWRSSLLLWENTVGCYCSGT